MEDRIVLGTAMLGVDGRDLAYELLDEYVALSGRTIDTASVYSDWIPGDRGRAETVDPTCEVLDPAALRQSLTQI